MGNHSKCLICDCTTTKDRSGQGSDFSSSTTKHHFHRHLYVIFILRNILELPVHQLANHLKDNWDVQDWISLCDKCDELVVKCRGVYDQLLQISKKFKSCQLTIINIVKESGYGVGGRSNDDRKEKRNFVEQVRDIVSECDYDHLIDPIEKMKSLACQAAKVKNEVTDQTKVEDVSTDPMIKTELESENEDNDDPAFSADEPEAPEFNDDDEKDNGLSEGHKERKPDDNEINSGSTGTRKESGKSGNGQLKILKAAKNKDIRKRKPLSNQQNTTKIEKFFLCPLCKVYMNSITFENSFHVCIHMDKCGHNIKTWNEKKKIAASQISELKCRFCSLFSCPINDISRFVNHLVSCATKPSSTPLRYRVFQCNICTDNKSSTFFTMDDFIRHYCYHAARTYKCTECGHPFSSIEKDNCSFHWRTSHRDLLSSSAVPISNMYAKLESPLCPAVPWYCSDCGELLKDEAELDKHYQTVHPLLSSSEQAENVNCQFCNKHYRYSDELKLHLGTAHMLQTDKLFECDKCSDVFLAKPDILTHLRRYHKADLFECPICRAEFVEDGKFLLHVATHHQPANDNGIAEEEPEEERYFKCQICSKEYATKNGLANHIATAHRRTFACPTCGKRFPYLNSLSLHRSRCHGTGMSSMKILSCPVDKCGRKFRYENHLKIHVATHEKKTKCSSCGADFYTENELKCHRKSVHDEGDDTPKDYLCDECPFSSNFRWSLKVHQRRHEPSGGDAKKSRGSWECDACSAVFRGSSALERHRRRDHGQVKRTNRKYICETCGQVLKSRVTLRAHKERSLRCRRLYMSEEEATVMCEICGKRFGSKVGLNQHILQTHEGIYKATCAECGLGFCSVLRMNRHVAAVHTPGKCYKFKCSVEGCLRTFPTSWGRRRHHQQQHQGIPEQYKCGECGKVFSCSRNRSRHERSVHGGAAGVRRRKNQKKLLPSAAAAEQNQKSAG